MMCDTFKNVTFKVTLILRLMTLWKLQLASDQQTPGHGFTVCNNKVYLKNIDQLYKVALLSF